MLHLKTTTVNAAGETVDTTTQYTGINWTGWKYVEADLSSVYDKAQDVENHPLKITAGQVLLWTIIIEGGTGDVDGNKITCGSRAAGSLYVDNIRAVYGTTADDLENPVITSVRGGSASITGYSDLTELAEDGSTVLTDNELQFFTGYYDPQGENRTGVSAENTVITIDGHDVEQIREALTAANAEKERPTLIIGRTVMGKGAVAADGSSFEDKVSTHGQPLTAAGADFAATVRNLGGDAEDPFKIFSESGKVFDARREELREWVRTQREREKTWRSEHKELSRKLDLFLSGKVPEMDYKGLEIKPDGATRAASASVLSFYAERIENMIVASADLCNSDKTDGYLKKTKAFSKGDFSGKFFQAGVSELTMACIANGMALHGGVIPACGTFFVFSDYMKPAVRLAALMHLHVIYIWTHDSFRVGEDGPTHQPVEHEAQIRLMEHLKNHRGERSMLVLRPADGEETVTAWKLAIEEHRPVALILSRQNIKNLPALNHSRREEAAQLSKGAYIVVDAAKPAVVMLASGSEVATLVEGAELLSKEGIAVRIVSVPSEGLFRDQPKSYQQTVLPQGVVRYGLTSGLPVTLLGLVGENGMIHGLDHFGYSAPYKVLDEKFGYNGQTVYEEVKKLISK